MARPAAAGRAMGVRRSRCSRPSSRSPSTTRTPCETSTSTSGGPGSWLPFPSASPPASCCRSDGGAWSRPTASRSPAPHAVRVWCLSQTARYLPTGVAGFAARVVMAAKEGVPRTLTSATLAIELGLLAAWAGTLRRGLHPVERRVDAVAGAPRPRRLAVAIGALPALLALGGRLFPACPRSHHTSSIAGRCTRRHSSTASTRR